ncbi:hypothetical protein NEHOM01_1139 [Nematocida homosporus]|uniref:uncharacterized protein n=1 Tax=Nematocida homosporus TaxID=1912981 RepID=UPI00221FA540|nr:uncharacterized protein NEHOM01_1139 [Nematocida homosporus]KAI5185889.1 hypothetical protein NEHOM01_1139 [Nematocida homosporus]
MRFVEQEKPTTNLLSSGDDMRNNRSTTSYWSSPYPGSGSIPKFVSIRKDDKSASASSELIYNSPTFLGISSQICRIISHVALLSSVSLAAVIASLVVMTGKELNWGAISPFGFILLGLIYLPIVRPWGDADFQKTPKQRWLSYGLLLLLDLLIVGCVVAVMIYIFEIKALRIGARKNYVFGIIVSFIIGMLFALPGMCSHKNPKVNSRRMLYTFVIIAGMTTLAIMMVLLVRTNYLNALIKSGAGKGGQ